ncbi:MAG: phosphoribosyl-ATP diphosphatase [Pyrobaculum sp.]
MTCDVLKKLEDVIQSRIREGSPQSYTFRLYNSGVHNVAKKVGEEAVEAAVAALAESRERLISEAADLLYHLLVLLAARGVALEEVCQELAKRMK